MSSTAYGLGPTTNCFLAGPLTFAAPRQWHRVVEIDTAAPGAQRLTEMGLVPGARLFLAAVSRGGAVVQLAGHGRLGVDLDLAQLVWVETAE